MSNVRVSVEYTTPAVFAGEKVQCIITFRNIAPTATSRATSAPSPQTGSNTIARDGWKEVLRNPQRANDTSATGPRLSEPASHRPTRGHEIANSVSNPVGAQHGHTITSSKDAQGGYPIERHGHTRAISIVSLGKVLPQGDIHRSQGQQSAPPKSVHGRVRAASMQLLPSRDAAESNGHIAVEGAASRRAVVNSRSTTAGANAWSTTPPPPLVRRSTYTAKQRGTSKPNVSASSKLGSPSPRLESQSSLSATNPANTFILPISNFALPQESRRSGTQSEASQLAHQSSTPSSPWPSNINSNVDSYNPVSRVLSSTNINETPRSSGEFFSLSNNSSETLASDYIERQQISTPVSPWHSRQSSLLDPSLKVRVPEKLMMGYVQLSGSFSVDGSLINKSVFDETRRKGIIGDQGGGGLVREDARKRESGFFGSLGWGSIGAPLEGFLGGSELSSIKGSRESERNIPILSTPQSILFVDLQLAPGESKSFEYSHILPRGIPPSHKGKAMKVTYHLVIGTQRFIASAHKHHVQHVDIPFRVLPGVNAQGEILGHDLMLPYILLHNAANISTPKDTASNHPSAHAQSSPKQSKGTEQDFLSYVGESFSRSQPGSDQGLLSPTETGYNLLSPYAEEPRSMKEAIDLVVLRGSNMISAKRNATRFDIAKEGARVALITLSRSIYRLGDAVCASIDFSGADVPCYSLHATLESSETVDTSVALRSLSSIRRATRQIHASQGTTTVYARRVSFSPVIPVASTPSFLTSAIDNKWDLRFEFVTGMHNKKGDGEEDDVMDLLEEIACDERAAVHAAIQTLPCEAFDISIPLTVYGAARATDESINVHDLPI